MGRGLLEAAIALGAACALLACEPGPAGEPTAGGAASAPGALTGGLPERQRLVFERACAHCHLRPGIGVPQLGDARAWEERARDGREALLRRTVLGSGAMPPLGTCAFCSEDDLRLLVAFLAGLPGGANAPSAGRGPNAPSAGREGNAP